MEDQNKKEYSVTPYLYPASLILLVCVFFVESFFTDAVFLPYGPAWETSSQWYPYITFLSHMWNSGEFPLWSKNLSNGFPLASFPHVGAFYPPHLIFIFFEFGKGFPLLALTHLICRALLMYGLLREWPHSRFVSWIFAAAFVMSGYSMHISGYLQMFNTLTWLPGILWFSLRLIRHARIIDFILLTIISSMGYLAGGLEILLYSWIIFYAFILFIEKPSIKQLLLPGLCLIASILLCACQFFITYNYLHHSYRIGQDFNLIQTHLTNLLLFPYMFLPWFPGKADVLSVGYCGIIQIFGFFCAIRTAENKRLAKVVLVISIIVVIFIANIWPFNHLFNIIPIVKFGRAGMHYRAIFPLIIIFTIYAAGGLNSIIKGINKSASYTALGFLIFFIVYMVLFVGLDVFFVQKLTFLIVSRIVLILFLIVTGYELLKSAKTSQLYGLKPWVLVSLLMFDMFVLSYLGMHRVSPSAFSQKVNLPYPINKKVPDRIHLISPFDNDLILWKMMRLDQGPGFIFAYIENGIKRNHELFRTMTNNDFTNFSPEIINHDSLSLLNYLSVSYVVSHAAPVYLSDPAPLASPYNKSTFYIGEEYQDVTPKKTDPGYMMPPGSTWNVSMVLMAGDHLVMEFGHESNAPPSFQILKDSSVLSASLQNASYENEHLTRIDCGLDVKQIGTHIISISISDAAQIINPRIENNARPFKEIDGPAFSYYLNQKSLDIHGLYNSVIIADDKKAREIIFNTALFDPYSQLVLSSDDADMKIMSQQKRTRKKGDVKVLKYEDNHQIMEVFIDNPCYLSVAQTFYPGWKAWVDGKQVKIIRANYAFCAIKLSEPGKHRISFKYIPTDFRVGLWISISSLVFFMTFSTGVFFTGFRSKT